jgi:hypothetical protein
MGGVKKIGQRSRTPARRSAKPSRGSLPQPVRCTCAHALCHTLRVRVCDIPSVSSVPLMHAAKGKAEHSWDMRGGSLPSAAPPGKRPLVPGA